MRKTAVERYVPGSETPLSEVDRVNFWSSAKFQRGFGINRQSRARLESHSVAGIHVRRCHLSLAIGVGCRNPLGGRQICRIGERPKENQRVASFYCCYARLQALKATPQSYWLGGRYVVGVSSGGTFP